MTKAKILIAEDEGIIALDIKSRLEDLGYTVPCLASSGEDAVRRTEETQPDLVLMDVLLRGDMDGIEAGTEIRARYNVPVVFMTALSDPETLERGRKAKPSGWLSKPVEMQRLQQVIDKALSQHQRAKEEVE